MLGQTGSPADGDLNNDWYFLPSTFEAESRAHKCILVRCGAQLLLVRTEIERPSAVIGRLATLRSVLGVCM